jgi:hypothetical protein
MASLSFARSLLVKLVAAEVIKLWNQAEKSGWGYARLLEPGSFSVRGQKPMSEVPVWREASMDLMDHACSPCESRIPSLFGYHYHTDMALSMGSHLGYKSSRCTPLRAREPSSSHKPKLPSGVTGNHGIAPKSRPCFIVDPHRAGLAGVGYPPRLIHWPIPRELLCGRVLGLNRREVQREETLKCTRMLSPPPTSVSDVITSNSSPLRANNRGMP